MTSRPATANPVDDCGWGRVALAAMVVGVALRIAMLLAGRPLWLDEAMLALNVMARGYRDLLGPLDYDQAAPPLFLWLAHALGAASGGNELALRAVPIAAGMLVLPALWWVGRTLFNPAVGAVATALAALSPTLIYYSGEFKPYISDATIAIVMVGLAWRAAPARPWGREWWQLLGGGLLALGLSLTAPMVLATAGLVLACRGPARRPGWRALGPAVVAGCTWVLAYAALYLAVLRPATGSGYLREFWAGGFLSAQPSLRVALYQVAIALAKPLPLPETDIRMAVLLPVVAGLGLAALWRFGWLRLLPWFGMVTLALLVSALGLYPLDGRLFLFLAPATLLVLAAGLVALTRLFRLGPGLQALVLATGVLGPVAWAAAPLGRGPGSETRDRSVLRQAIERPPGTPLYLLTGGAPRFVYYSTDWTAPDRDRLAWYARVLSWGGPGFRNGPWREEDQARLSPPGYPLELVAHSSGSLGGVDNPAVRAWADAEVGRLRGLEAPEVWLYGGHYRERDLPHLLDALARRGLGWRVVAEGADATLLSVRLTSGNR